MPFDPIFTNYAGMLPILQNARTIIERDIEAALSWSYGVNPPGEKFKRIQYVDRHSGRYPQLSIEPALSDPTWITGGVQQVHTFDCTISLLRSIDGGVLSDEIDQLPQDLIRYLDATLMVFMSAPGADWRVNLTSEQGKVEVQVQSIDFGRSVESIERKGQYFSNVSFQLVVSLTESEQ